MWETHYKCVYTNKHVDAWMRACTCVFMCVRACMRVFVCECKGVGATGLPLSVSVRMCACMRARVSVLLNDSVPVITQTVKKVITVSKH